MLSAVIDRWDWSTGTFLQPNPVALGGEQNDTHKGMSSKMVKQNFVNLACWIFLTSNTATFELSGVDAK